MSRKSFAFASIQRPTWRYRIYRNDSDNPASDWKRDRYSMSTYVSQYDTMGDGETQHSPDCHVATEDTYDFVRSLSISIHRLRIDLDDEENCETEVLRYLWKSESSVDEKTIRFFADLKFNEKKDTFFSVHEKPQKSHADSKRFDKRWFKLERDCEGESKASRVLRLIHCVDHLKPYKIIQWIATVMKISEVLCEDTSWHWDAVMELKRGTIFKDISNHDMHCFIDCFENITRLKESVWNIRAARGFSQRTENQVRHEQNKAREKAELQAVNS